MRLNRYDGGMVSRIGLCTLATCVGVTVCGARGMQIMLALFAIPLYAAFDYTVEARRSIEGRGDSRQPPGEPAFGRRFEGLCDNARQARNRTDTVNGPSVQLAQGVQSGHENADEGPGRFQLGQESTDR